MEGYVPRIICLAVLFVLGVVWFVCVHSDIE